MMSSAQSNMRDPDNFDIRVAILQGELVPSSEVERWREALRECVDVMRAYDLPLTPAEDGARSLLDE